MKIITFNLRIQVEIDAKHQYIYRYKKIADYINNSKADFISLQEVNHFMLQKLLPLLPDYDYIGEGREPNGETSGILYHQSWSVIESETIWLSDTPRVQSKFDDSYFLRVATRGVFIKKGKRYSIVNTHLDYHNDVIQAQQMDVLLKIFHISPQIITGDFNATPDDIVHYDLREQGYHSVYNEDDLMKATYNGFSHIIQGNPIDYIYFKDYIQLERAIIDQESCREFFLSDHYPVIAYFE